MSDRNTQGLNEWAELGFILIFKMYDLVIPFIM
jgi:hypothetical protein